MEDISFSHHLYLCFPTYLIAQSHRTWVHNRLLLIWVDPHFEPGVDPLFFDIIKETIGRTSTSVVDIPILHTELM